MTDTPPTTDGGTSAPAERDVRRAGERPPDVPNRTTVEDLLPRLLADADEMTTGYHIRARLDGDDPSQAAEQLVKALERKVAVVGTTLDAGVDPDDPQLDVLIECDHTMSQVASALARVAPVDGAVVLDVTAECEHVLEDQEESEAADAADANDVFNELQQQVSEADYDQVVDELEDVSFPGGPDADQEVDLEETAGVELSGDDTDREEATAGAIDLGDGGGMDTDEVSAEDLFGEGGTDSETTPSTGSGADETTIEEAVRNVEENADGEAVPAGDPAADDAETAAAESAGPEGDEQTAGEPPAEPAETSDEEPAAEPAETSDEEPAAEPAEPSDSTAQSDADESAAATDADEPAEAVAEPDEPSPTEEPAEGPTPAADDATPAARTDGAAAAGAGDVDATVDALIRALESGEVGPDRRQRLREAMGIESTHSLDVRLEYLQKRVDNLAAYNDAWEAFLSEEGTGNQFIEDVRERLDELEAEVESVEGGPDGELVERVESLEATVEELDAGARLAAVEDRLDDLEGRHEELARRHDEDVSRIEGRLETFGDAIEKLKESLQQFADWRERVNEVLRG